MVEVAGSTEATPATTETCSSDAGAIRSRPSTSMAMR